MPATFDPSRQLDLYFRVARAGSKTFTFVDSVAADYSLAAIDFQFVIKDYFGNTLLTLTEGNGLTVQNTNELVIAITVAQSTLTPAEYYYQLNLTSSNKTWLNGKAFFHTGIFDGVTETTTLTITESGDDITVTISEAVSSATQSEVNTGTSTTTYVSPSTLQDKDDTAVALVDGATIDITGPKHTLATAVSRTFTISHTGDDIVLVITLTATSGTFTFPAAALCVADGTASGDNTLVITGAVSGDKHVVAIIKVGSGYYVVSKNVGQ